MDGELELLCLMGAKDEVVLIFVLTCVHSVQPVEFGEFLSFGWLFLLLTCLVVFVGVVIRTLSAFCWGLYYEVDLPDVDGLRCRSFLFLESLQLLMLAVPR